MMITLTPTLRNQPKTLLPDAKTHSQAAFSARLYERAKRLTQDGYRIMQAGRTPVFGIFKPGNTETRFGWRDYCVDLTPGKANCTCEFFAENKKSCKHIEATLIAVRRAIDEEEEILSMERLWEAAETAEGTDPHYWLDPR